MAFSEMGYNLHPSVDGLVACEGLWDHPHHWLRLALFRRALASFYGARLVGISEDTTRPEVFDSLNALGIERHYVLPTQNSSNHYVQARQLLRGIRTARDIIALDFGNRFDGSLLYDSILKSEWLGTVDASYPSIEFHLASAIRYFECYQKFLDEFPLRAVVVSHPVTARFSILTHLALQRGIPVFVINYVNEHITIRKLARGDPWNCMPVEFPTFSEIEALSGEKRRDLVHVGLNYLRKIRSGDVSEFASIGIHRQGSKITVTDRARFASIVGCDPNKKNIVVFGNCWPDFPNAYGKTWFTDYVEFFKITLESIKRNPQYNWIVRPHPAEFLYGDRLRLVDLIRDQSVSNCYFWPKTLSTSVLASYADVVVTARGSAGWEYTGLGKAVIVGAPTAYTPLEFVPFAKSREEYEQLLSRAGDLSKPSDNFIEMAHLFIALTQTSVANKDQNYAYDWGSLSYKIWPKIPKFVEENKENMEREVKMIELWLKSTSHSYNVFKVINNHLW